MLTDIWRRGLAATQLAGGALTIAGFVLTFQIFGYRLRFWLVLLAAAFALAAIVAGLELLRGTRRGLLLSMAVQGAQILTWSAGWRYVWLAGPKITWVVASVGTGVSVGGGGTFLLDPNPVDGQLNGVGLTLEIGLGVWPRPLAEASWTIGLNAFALLAFVHLWDAYEKSRNATARPSTADRPDALATDNATGKDPEGPDAVAV